MKVYLFKNDFSRSEVERFTKKQCEQILHGHQACLMA